MKFLKKFKKKPSLPHVTLPYTQEVSRQQKKFLIMFIIFLLFASFYSYTYAKEKINEKQLVKVIVASKNIQAPSLLKESDIKEIFLPKKDLPELIPLLKDIIGKTVVDSLVKNEMILFHNIQRDTNDKSVASSDLFKRDLAIEISDKWLMSPLPDIFPNDRVSLLVVNPSKQDNSSKFIAKNIIVISKSKDSIVLNMKENEIQDLIFARSLKFPMQIIVHPNKVDNIDESFKQNISSVISEQSLIDKFSEETSAKNNEKIIDIKPQQKLQNIVYSEINQEGDEVKNLQTFLNYLGYKNAMTGYFGSYTTEGIKWYQKKYGLKETSMLDDFTLNSMNKEINIINNK